MPFGRRESVAAAGWQAENHRTIAKQHGVEQISQVLAFSIVMTGVLAQINLRVQKPAMGERLLFMVLVQYRTGFKLMAIEHTPERQPI